MGLYYSQLKRQQEVQQQPLLRTASYDPLVTKKDVNVGMQENGYWDNRDSERELEKEIFKRPTEDPNLVREQVEQKQLARDIQTDEVSEEDKIKNLREKGNISVVDPKTGQKKYFVDSHVNKIAGKNWEDLSLMDKLIISGEEVGAIGRSLSGNVGLGGASKLLSATGGMIRQIEMINTLGQANKIQEKLGIDKTASQYVMDWANKVSEYQQKEFGSATYKAEDITLKNIPKLLVNPEFILNSLSNAVSTGIVAKAGGVPSLYALESGGLLTEKRAEALMRGEKATTNKEVLFSMGMGLVNAWLENFTFKVMTGTGKIPIADKIISGISNNLLKGITSWGSKVATEMGEEFVQEALPMLVSEAIFKEKDDLRNMFERVVDKMPEAMKQGEMASVMALPGAAVLSGLGMMQEGAIQKQQQQLAETEIEIGEKVSESFKESMSDFELMEKGRKENFKAGLKTGVKMIEDGKLNSKIQERVTRDLTTKINKLGTQGEALSNYINAGLKGKTFNNFQEYTAVVQGLIRQGMSPTDVKTFNEATGFETKVKLKDVLIEGDTQFNNAVELVSNKGDKTLRQTQVAPQEIEYDGMQDNDFGNDPQSKNALKQVKAGKGKPVVAEFKDGKLKVIDGNHILWAYKKAGYSTVPVIMNGTNISQLNSQQVEQITPKIEENAVSPEEQIKGVQKAAETVRLKDTVPKKDLKYVFAEAEKAKVTNQLAKAITKPLTEEEVTGLSEKQKAILITGLEGIAAAENIGEGVIVENIQTLGGTAPVEAKTEAASEVVTPPKSQVEVEKVEADIQKVTPKTIDKSIERLAKIDEDTLSKDEARKTEALATRQTLRAKIAENLKKDATTFVDVKTGKDKQSAFTISVKKLPNLKYGYAITMNTPQSSQAINYVPKFGTRAKAMKMGIQRAIRMIETARQQGVPSAGLTRIKNVVMKANTKLGKKALPVKKVKKILKETKKQLAKKSQRKIVKKVKAEIKRQEEVGAKKSKPAKKPVDNYLNKLKEQIGDIFDKVESVHSLWKSSGRIAYIKFKRHQIGEIEKLKQNPIIENVQEAGGNNVLKITFKKEVEVLKGSKLASVGDFSNVKSYEKHINKFSHVELPELIGIVKKLSGNAPYLKKMRETKRGVFQTATMRIALNPNIVGNKEVLNKVLAHELGHMTDFLPEKTMTRGNILGRIGSLRSFLKHTFTTKDGVITQKEIRDELWELSKMWRPVPLNSSESFLRYRKSSEELYADAISVLFNDPSLLETIAPKFYKSFLSELDKKPKVKRIFYDTWELINKGEEALLSKRQETIYEMFQKAEDVFKIKREENKETKENFMMKLKTELMDRNQPMIDKVKKAVKEGKKISDETNPIYFLEEYNYLAGVVKNYVETKIQPIMNNLEENGITWEDFGAVLLLERAEGERGKMANPGGFSTENAEKQLDFISKKLGKEKFEILKENIINFRNATDEVIEMAKDAGLYTPELLAQMNANKTYATFQVIDYLEDYIPASIKRQIGTFSDVANPATSTVMKMTSIIRAAEVNLTKKSMVDFLKEFDNKNIKDAETRFNGIFHEAIESKNPDEALFKILENGKIKGYYIDPYLNDIFERNSTITNKYTLIPALRTINKRVFRPAFIQYNLGFTTFNLVRDFWRFWKNIPGMRFGKAFSLYKKALPIAKRRALGELDSLVSEMEKKKIIGVTYNEMISGQESTDKQIEYVLEQSGLTPTTPKKRNKILAPFIKVLDRIDEIGQVVESLPKIAGYSYLKDSTLFSEKEMKSFIRTSVGSPDFFRKNAGYGWTNEVFLFSNAIKEAIRSDIMVMKNPKTRNGYWAKTVGATVAPKLLMVAASLGLFGEPLKEMFKNISEYDKTNYFTIPYGINKDGKTMYLRIPQDETSRFIGGIVWKTTTAFSDNKDGLDNLFQLFDYTGGQLPSISPVLDVATATRQFISGRNPYDFFRGRSIIPDTEFKAGGKYALKPFMLWGLQKMGASVLFNVNIVEQSPSSKSFGEKVLRLPLVSNVIGRWVRISDYGQIEEARNINKKVEKENSRRLIEWEKEINKSVKEYSKGEKTVANRDKIEEKLVKNILGNKPDTQQASYIRSKYKKTILKGFGDTKTKAVMSTYRNDAKIELLKSYQKSMNKKDFSEFLLDLKEQSIISETVYSEF